MKRLLFLLFLSLFQFPIVPSHASGLLSTDMEIMIGKDVRDQILDEYGEWDRPEDKLFIAEIAQPLVDLTERGLDYEFYIIEEDSVNAFAAPGGFVFVTTGLLDFCDRDPAMIAGVLAHEIGHIEHKHGRDALEDSLTRHLGLAILFDAFGVDDDWIYIAGEVALVFIEQGYSREDEYDADRMGIEYTYRAGWDPENGLIRFLQELDKELGDGNDLGDFGEWVSSHPENDQRVKFANDYLREMQMTMPYEPKPLPAPPPPPKDDSEEGSSQRYTLGEWEREDK